MQRRDALVSQVCAVVSRPPAVVLIGGAPGMGKSWLVDRVLPATEPRVVVGCRGLPAGRYVLVREVITAMVEAGRDRGLAGRAMSVIEAGDEYTVCQGVRALLGAAGATVVLEDVECADADSRRVVRYLATRLPAGVVLLVTYAPGSGPPLGGRLGSAAGTVFRVELTALTVPEVAALAQETAVAEGWAAAARRLPGGAPLARKTTGPAAAEGWAAAARRLPGGAPLAALTVPEVATLAQEAAVAEGWAGGCIG